MSYIVSVAVQQQRMLFSRFAKCLGCSLKLVAAEVLGAEELGTVAAEGVSVCLLQPGGSTPGCFLKEALVTL